jgi:hypothetical protein
MVRVRLNVGIRLWVKFRLQGRAWVRVRVCVGLSSCFRLGFGLHS